ncbi:uncharacterized protein LOC116588603 isoform X5 [Mustela erminea]|uniref:uncharacterized protein LOC116588603 isoform X5 n=1 Tax=Mustela erminea TaxID=36723 RepID=UPI0013870E17|nr:uncharacterized protein LOC116588603 isoform X5 [Mustela erminea]
MHQAGLLPPRPDSQLPLEVPASLCLQSALPSSPTSQPGLGLSHFVYLRSAGRTEQSQTSSRFPLPWGPHVFSCQPTGKGWEALESLAPATVAATADRRLVQSSRFSIWDNPSTGLFIVTMTGLKEEDSGHYWCRIYHASGNSVSKSIRFYLAVSPAPASTQASRASAELVSSPTQSSVPPAGRAKQAPRPASAITTLSPQQNSTLRSHPAAPSALVPVLCVLLVAKGLALTVLTVRALRSPHVQHRGKSLMHPAPPRPQASGSKDGQSSPGPQGAPPWTLNLLFTAKKRQKSPRTCSKTLGYTPRSSAEDFPASPRPKIQAHQLLTRNWLLGQHHPGMGAEGQCRSCPPNPSRHCGRL